MSDKLIELSDVGKRYPRITRPRDRVRALGRLLRGREPDGTTVLAGVDLRVHRGESVGVVGENGAGKSTLLKLVCGVLTPSTGTIAVHGTVSAMLELGAGFHQQYTGRENLEMAGSLMGLTREELDARMDGIIEFADIGAYLDEPINHYSSGMVVRLGFSLVASVHPDLLVTDEVLAVGDEAFQKKCIRWMEDYIADGGTLVLVSHSMYHIRKLCRRACWVHDGRMRLQGDAATVSQAYQAYLEQKSAQPQEQAQAADRDVYRVVDFRVAGSDGEPPPQIAQGDDLTMDGVIYSPDDRPPAMAVGILRVDGTPVYGTISDLDGFTPQRDGAKRFTFGLTYPEIPLLPGTYQVRLHALDPRALAPFDTRVLEFAVRGQSRELGYCRLAHTWHHPKPTADETAAPTRRARDA